MDEVVRSCAGAVLHDVAPILPDQEGEMRLVGPFEAAAAENEAM